MSALLIVWHSLHDAAEQGRITGLPDHTYAQAASGALFSTAATAVRLESQVGRVAERVAAHIDSRVIVRPPVVRLESPAVIDFRNPPRFSASLVEIAPVASPPTPSEVDDEQVDKLKVLHSALATARELAFGHAK